MSSGKIRPGLLWFPTRGITRIVPWHIGSVKDDKEAIRIMHAALDGGMTFFDNAWDYHDGHSEEVMGQALAMPGKRKQCFLMTKNCGRDAKTIQQHLEDSLRRLQTDVIDLMQFHEINYDNDPDWIVERGGLAVLLKAQNDHFAYRTLTAARTTPKERSTTS